MNVLPFFLSFFLFFLWEGFFFSSNQNALNLRGDVPNIILFETTTIIRADLTLRGYTLPATLSFPLTVWLQLISNST